MMFIILRTTINDAVIIPQHLQSSINDLVDHLNLNCSLAINLI